MTRILYQHEIDETPAPVEEKENLPLWVWWIAFAVTGAIWMAVLLLTQFPAMTHVTRGQH